jgi:hypothetical protein
MDTQFYQEILKERDNSGGYGIDYKVMLKGIL